MKFTYATVKCALYKKTVELKNKAVPLPPCYRQGGESIAPTHSGPQH
jgi:hypothetical protein